MTGSSKSKSRDSILVKVYRFCWIGSKVDRFRSDRIEFAARYDCEWLRYAEIPDVGPAAALYRKSLFNLVVSASSTLFAITMFRNTMKSKKSESLKFGYSVTRDITVPHFTPVILCLGGIFTAVIAVVVVITVGYEPVTQLWGSFNNTLTLWYNSLPLFQWMLPLKNCTSSVLKVGESTSPSS
jgi:hypothetical protein